METSEAAAYKRSTSDSKYLCKDWDYCIHMREVRKNEEQTFVEKCGKEMKEIIKKNIEAEEKRKDDHRKNCMKYQRDLDHQLQANRSRSLAALTGMLCIVYMYYMYICYICIYDVVVY